MIFLSHGFPLRKNYRPLHVSGVAVEKFQCFPLKGAVMLSLDRIHLTVLPFGLGPYVFIAKPPCSVVREDFS